MRLKKLFLLVISVSLFGCTQKSESLYDLANRNELNDSLKKGNYKWVAQELGRQKKEALENGDSLKWAYCVVEEGGVAFFMADEANMISKSDTALRFGAGYADLEKVKNLMKRANRIRASYYHQYSFVPDSAEEYHKRALKYTSEEDHGEYILGLANLADAYKVNARYPEATDIYHRAELFADSVGASAPEYEIIYSGLAGTYTAMGDYEEAEKWWGKTMDLYAQMDTYARFTNLNNLGNHYYKRKDYPKALSTFLHLESFLDSIGAADWEKNFCKVNLADVYLSLDSLDQADRLLKETVPYFENMIPGSVPMSHIHNLQMKLATRIGNISEVESLITRCPLNDTLRNEQLEGRLAALSEFYQHTGNWQKAFRTEKQLEHLRDSVVSQKVRQIIGSQKLAYERDTNLLSLKADNQSKQARIYRLFAYLGLSLLGLAVLAIIMIIIRQRSRKREERMLRKIIDLRMKSVRTRITPHFIYNALNNELLARQRGEEPSLPVLVSLLRRQQLMADNITDSIEEELDFMRDYIEIAGNRISAPFQYEENIDETIDLKSILLPSMSLQILAENAFKHGFLTLPDGEARRLWVEIVREDGHIVIRITNNISPESKLNAVPGMGLRIITETIDYMNHSGKEELTFHAGRDTDGFWCAIFTIN